MYITNTILDLAREKSILSFFKYIFYADIYDFISSNLEFIFLTCEESLVCNEMQAVIIYKSRSHQKGFSYKIGKNIKHNYVNVNFHEIKYFCFYTSIYHFF
ncbi:hypothetical protein EDEG_03414 [Edhazardia aedis USNM 41457]|uniref:Uncharacterized protein n=1 Tax=Edhazardia aedis (strain USNM 41457) TaxID=1003232 RepID=J9D2W2_EDHAE|nr:hypothetical protein EDEG_03414 [Edhazardia aedis USNM 41457]|eukprot:EJW02146.1 hypothetical protein EDEG_03414 [Edhazardia aedis USNM 41457]